MPATRAAQCGFRAEVVGALSDFGFYRAVNRFDRHIQRFGDVDNPFVEHAATAVLDVNQDISRDARHQCQCVLGKSAL